ncbi:uncharacterized protein N7482_005095 [Penicillium canariense]|uniref:Uncharacterized protein n=1 Tax=Penicillium canariense TaxID=189055 RepID=A0A9W9LLW8_9EURO|nr:uncharacterized protein N7482_005095 [Penicillium canariense]KAJ5166314.1 hypothetical protein N7482_005095 [Penicillium canariense]
MLHGPMVRQNNQKILNCYDQSLLPKVPVCLGGGPSEGPTRRACAPSRPMFLAFLVGGRCPNRGMGPGFSRLPTRSRRSRMSCGGDDWAHVESHSSVPLPFADDVRPVDQPRRPPHPSWIHGVAGLWSGRADWSSKSDFSTAQIPSRHSEQARQQLATVILLTYLPLPANPLQFRTEVGIVAGSPET